MLYWLFWLLGAFVGCLIRFCLYLVLLLSVGCRVFAFVC